VTTSHKLALLGDDRGHRSHQELNALVPRLARECSLAAEWVPTDSAFDVTGYDAVWLVPGSPYADDAAVIEALSVVRTQGIPFLGTCGGMQYAVLEFLRVVCGQPATHEESDGTQDDNAVSALACSLYGEERLVTPVPGSRFGSWVAEPFLGVHYCNYAATADAIAQLTRAGVVVGATAPDAGAEVLEFPNHPFYVTSMFQPHIGASRGAALHPLIRAFAGAVHGG
jgi:CTP synthase (UTP-ammonia lyase)